MYPPQTSLIPATVALIRFFEDTGFAAFSQNYPYWYLGSTPYKYLTGPVLPLAVHYTRLILGYDLNTVILFNILIYIIIISWVISALGWLLLIQKLIDFKPQPLISESKTESVTFKFILFLLFLLLPWKYIAGLALNDPAATLAVNLLPLTLYCYWLYLEKKTSSRAIIGIVSSAFLLLLSTSIIPILIIGTVALAAAYAYQQGKFRQLTNYLKSILLLSLVSMLVVSLYYSPAYWLTILTNPSIGGVTGFKVILRIVDLVKSLLPVVLAVATVFYSGRIKSRLRIFTLIWLFSFSFLTFFRFIGDPDFWQDWSAWLVEIEIGIFWLLVVPVQAVIHYLFTYKQSKNYPINLYNKSTLLIVSLVLVYLMGTFSLYRRLDNPKLLQDRPATRVVSLVKVVESISKDNPVFLSGSLVFWSNAWGNIYQLRGGKDEVALHPEWDKAAWEIREGSDPLKTVQWLTKLNIPVVVVNTVDSTDYYHDFKNLDKWQKIGQPVWSEDGDEIYLLNRD